MITFENAATWTPLSHEDCGAMPGKDVFGRDGEKLGVIAAVVAPGEEAPGAPGGRVFLVEPDPLAAGTGGDLYVPEPPLGGLVLRPDALADRGEGPDALYVAEAAIADVGADGVNLVCGGDELDARGWLATPAGLADSLRA